jgi:hypothetical protein
MYHRLSHIFSAREDVIVLSTFCYKLWRAALTLSYAVTSACGPVWDIGRTLSYVTLLITLKLDDVFIEFIIGSRRVHNGK